MIEISNHGFIYYFENGKYHRANGLPAVERSDGSRCYLENGNYHRANGLPAVECADGTKYYYENGKEYFPKERNKVS